MRSLYVVGFILLVSLSWAQAAMGECTGAVVNMPDPNLEAALRDALGKPTGDLTESDLCTLTVLDISAELIVDITGLGAAVNLTELDLSDNLITDLSALAGIQALATLNLTGNDLTSLNSVPAGLVAASVQVDGNQLTDLSGVENFAGMNSLEARRNPIANVSALAALTELQILDISDCEVTNISSLSTLTKLKNFFADRNAIENIGAMTFWEDLFVLGLENNQINDLQPLTLNPGLQGGVAYFGGNPLDANSVCVVLPYLRETVMMDVFATQECLSEATAGECATASELTLNVNAFISSIGATGSDVSSCGTADTADVWFAFDAPGLATYRFLSDGTGIVPVITVYDACGGTELACGVGELEALLPGGDYAVRIAGDNGATGSVRVLASLAACGSENPDTFVDDVVTFADENLEFAVRTAIGKPVGDLFESDVCTLAELQLDNADIGNLSGIEEFENLLVLDLQGNPIGNLGPISGITTLTDLDVSKTAVTGLTALNGLSSLRRLVLNESPISLSGLTAKPTLDVLNMDSTGIAGLGPLSSLFPNLIVLSFSNNPLSDLAPLSGLASLRSLDARNCDITDIAPLSGLTALEQFSFEKNEISNLGPLSGLTALAALGLSFNKIVEITPLVNNAGIGAGDLVLLDGNPLSKTAACLDSATLRSRGAEVFPDSCPSGTANDTCEEAVELYAGVPVNGSTVGSEDPLYTPGPFNLSCSGPMGSGGVYFTFTPSVAGYAVASTCGSDFDTYLVVQGNCGSEFPSNCSDGGTCGPKAEVAFLVIPGVEVAIRLNGAEGASGSYSLVVHEFADNPVGGYEPEPELACGEDALFSQASGANPLLFGVTSDTEFEIPLDEAYEFAPVENTRITSLTIWGRALGVAGDCGITSLRVRARADQNGTPGAQIYSELASVEASEPIPQVGVISLFRYEITLPEPLDVLEGGVWLGVVDDTHPACLFGWMISPEGDGLHGLVDSSPEDTLSTTFADMSLCVFGEALGEGGTTLLDLIEDFADADEDADGKIEPDEAEQYGITPELFEELDRNGDELLTPAELMQAADNESARASVDTNLDGKVSLAEVLRIVQFYNAGGYRCAEAETEDGYEPGPFPKEKAIDPGCLTHDNDYNPDDGMFNLSELLRVIQLFAGEGYVRCEGGEDGFCVE